MSTPYIRKAYFVFFSFFFFYILLDEKVCKKTDSNRWPCKEKVGTCYPTFNRVDFYLLLASTLNTHYAAMPLNCFFHLPQHFVPPRFVPVLALPSGGMVCPLTENRLSSKSKNRESSYKAVAMVQALFASLNVTGLKTILSKSFFSDNRQKSSCPFLGRGG